MPSQNEGLRAQGLIDLVVYLMGRMGNGHGAGR